MASYSSGLNPNVVRTILDDIFDQVFGGPPHAYRGTALTPAIFKQDRAENSAVVWELFKGVGPWETRQEEQDVPAGAPRVGNQKVFSVLNFAKSVDIPKNFFDDNMHAAYEKMVRNFALRGVTSRDKNAFALFRNGFGSQTTSDGVAVFSESHTNLNNDTVDNRMTDALSETSLNDGIVQLAEMRSQDGEIDGFLAKTLVVPLKLFKIACEITEAELKSGVGDNDPNVYSDKYGIRVYTSPYLGAAAGGSDTAWFLLSEEHSIMRFLRQDVQKTLVDWTYQRNNNYIYKGEFREVVGAMSFEGILGSNGTT